MSADLNKLIGIPFKLNRRDFGGCDCRGIVYLYYKYIKNKEIPFTDGKRIFFRNVKHDTQRIIDVVKTFADPVNVDELKEGDIVIINTLNMYGALGVCINNTQVLHIDKFVGSCLTKIRYMRELFIASYRPHD